MLCLPGQRSALDSLSFRTREILVDRKCQCQLWGRKQTKMYCAHDDASSNRPCLNAPASSNQDSTPLLARNRYFTLLMCGVTANVYGTDMLTPRGGLQIFLLARISNCPRMDDHLLRQVVLCPCQTGQQYEDLGTQMLVTRLTKSVLACR